MLHVVDFHSWRLPAKVISKGATTTHVFPGEYSVQVVATMAMTVTDRRQHCSITLFCFVLWIYGIFYISFDLFDMPCTEMKCRTSDEMWKLFKRCRTVSVYTLQQLLFTFELISVVEMWWEDLYELTNVFELAVHVCTIFWPVYWWRSSLL